MVRQLQCPTWAHGPSAHSGKPQVDGLLGAGLFLQHRWSAWSRPLSPVFPGLISFSPQDPQGRQDHRDLQAPQAPKVTGARQERKAQQGLLVRALAWSFVYWGTETGVLPYLSRRVISETHQHPIAAHPRCSRSPASLVSPGLQEGRRGSGGCGCQRGGGAAGLGLSSVI